MVNVSNIQKVFGFEYSLLDIIRSHTSHYSLANKENYVSEKAFSII